MSAAERWQRDLEAWAIPPGLLDAVEESPYGWPPVLWRRRTQATLEDPTEPRTLDVIRRLLPDRGEVLDVGAGRGRASLPLTEEGHRLVAVERNPDMAAGLTEDARIRGVEVELIEGSWPEVADRVPAVDIGMCAHVVYDVQDIVPFLGALAGHSRIAVVLELTEHHPWSELAPLYLALHGLSRPDGPSAGDLAAVVEESLGVAPHVERWERGAGLWFESWDEILETYGRRLVLPPDRRRELRALLAESVVERDGRMYVGTDIRRLVTVWWET